LPVSLIVITLRLLCSLFPATLTSGWSKPLKITFALITIFVLLPSQAYAYVDPGAGSLILQMLAAIGVGAMFYMGKIKESIKNIFSRKKDDETNSSED